MQFIWDGEDEWISFKVALRQSTVFHVDTLVALSSATIGYIVRAFFLCSVRYNVVLSKSLDSSIAYREPIAQFFVVVCSIAYHHRMKRARSSLTIRRAKLSSSEFSMFNRKTRIAADIRFSGIFLARSAGSFGIFLFDVCGDRDISLLWCKYYM